MGICVTTVKRQVVSPSLVQPTVKLENAGRIDPAIKQKLIELKKIRLAPTVSLEDNPLFKRRLERRSQADYESTASPTASDNQNTTPFLECKQGDSDPQ